MLQVLDLTFCLCNLWHQEGILLLQSTADPWIVLLFLTFLYKPDMIVSAISETLRADHLGPTTKWVADNGFFLSLKSHFFLILVVNLNFSRLRRRLHAWIAAIWFSRLLFMLTNSWTGVPKMWHANNIFAYINTLVLRLWKDKTVQMVGKRRKLNFSNNFHECRSLIVSTSKDFVTVVNKSCWKYRAKCIQKTLWMCLLLLMESKKHAVLGSIITPITLSVCQSNIKNERRILACLACLQGSCCYVCG